MCENKTKQLNRSSLAGILDAILYQGSLINHTGQCKRTGGCYNELVVAFLRTGDGLKGKKSIPVDFMIYL